jgi:hypothetical protein
MANLLASDLGIRTLKRAVCFLAIHRISEPFFRNFYIEWDAWKTSGNFDLTSFLGQLNASVQDDLLSIGTFIEQYGCAGEESLEDKTIYVDPDNGNDLTGNGSSSAPYATLFFLPVLTKVKINHLYKILLLGDVNYGSTLTLTPTFGDGGCLSFVGVGPAVEVFSGSTINTTTNFQSTWNTINGVAAPAVGIVKSFVQMTSGADSGKALPVCKVDAPNSNFFFRRNPLTGLAPGHSYRFIEPAHTLTVNGLFIDGRGSRWTEGGKQAWRGGRICFVNLKIAIDYGGFSVDTIMSTVGVPTIFAFVQIEAGGDSSAFPVKFYNSVNQYRPVDPDLETVANCGVTNLIQGDSGAPNTCGMQFISPFGDEYTYSEHIVLIENGATVHACDAMGYVRATGSNTVRYVSAKQFEWYQTNSDSDYIAADPNNATPSALNASHSMVHVGHFLVGTCLNGIVSHSTRWYIFTGGGDDGSGAMTAIAGYAIDMDGQSKVYFRNGGWTGPTGAINDLYFQDPLPAVAAAFPAANAIVTDTLGNDCSRKL